MNTQNESMLVIQRLAHGELSVKARIGYVALLLLSSAMTVGLVSLWLTEGYLPLRTQLAFGAMTLIGISWAALAAWALATRRILLARDRVIAGWMSVAFTGVFLAGALAAAMIGGTVAGFSAAVAGAGMFAAALRVLSGARRRFTELSARRLELEREMGSGPISR